MFKYLYSALSGKYQKLKYLEGRDPEGYDNSRTDDDGTHDSPFSRLTPHHYDDLTAGGAMPASVAPTNPPGGPPFNGFPFVPIPTGPLPQPRAISDAVMAQGTADMPNSFGVNEFFQFFGQALTHDMAESATGSSGDFPLLVDGLPFPIGRTPYVLENGVRQQINEETSFLDLSMVYGNTQASLDLARADLRDRHGNPVVDSNGDRVQSAKLLLGDDGLLPTIKEAGNDSGIDSDAQASASLEVLRIFRPDGFGGLPNPDPAPTPGNPNPLPPADSTFENLFFAGDNRVNQTSLLIAQQTIWAREHNFQVAELTPLARKNGWSQDQLFEAARAITEAEWQHVIYDEYLPKLIGENALASYRGHKASVDPSIINEFTTVAFRFGHDQSSQYQKPLAEDGSAVNPGGMFSLFTLAEAFSAGANAARTTENIDEWVRGQLSSHSQEIDGLVVDGNRNTLFGIPGAPGQFTTVDLEVFDIQRARDHGVWNYNELRAGLGLSTYQSFADFGAANGVDPGRLAALSAAYGNDIGKLDSIVGGLLEEKYSDSQLGETFTLIIATQFEALRDGDRLFYENRFKGNPLLMAEIEQTSMADILARTTGIEHIYRDAFAAHTRVSDSDGSIQGSEAKDLAIGSNGNDLIRTFGGDDDVYGGRGRDFLFAGEGNDWLWGGKGRDVFVFEEASGYDVVKDFDVREDKLDLTEFGLDSWRDVRKAIQRVADGVLVTLDDADSVMLLGVKLGSLSARNFIYDLDHDYGVA